jgi:hypothetical protein
MCNAHHAQPGARPAVYHGPSLSRAGPPCLICFITHDDKVETRHQHMAHAADWHGHLLTHSCNKVIICIDNMKARRQVHVLHCHDDTSHQAFYWGLLNKPVRAGPEHLA